MATVRIGESTEFDPFKRAGEPGGGTGRKQLLPH